MAASKRGSSAFSFFRWQVPALAVSLVLAVLCAVPSAVASLPEYTRLVVATPSYPVLSRFLPSLDRLVISVNLTQWAPVTGPTATITVYPSGVTTGTPVLQGVLTQFTNNAGVWRASTSALPEGDYDVYVTVRNGAGNTLTQYDDWFDKESLDSFPWMTSPLGVGSAVPAPFAPLVASGNEVQSWGRAYDFAPTGLPQSMTSQGKPILTGPVTLSVKSSGQPVPVNVTTPFAFTSATPAQVTGTSVLTAGNLSVNLQCTTEYDGFMLFTLTYAPVSGNCSLSSMQVQIPISADRCLFYSAHGDRWGKYLQADVFPTTSGTVYDSLHDTSCVYCSPTFASLFFVADRDVCFCYAADNDQGWVANDAAPAVQAIRSGNTVTLWLNLVNKPWTLTGPRTLQFALQAGPTKPLPAGWRGVQDSQYSANAPVPILQVGGSGDTMHGGGYSSIHPGVTAAEQKVSHDYLVWESNGGKNPLVGYNYWSHVCVGFPEVRVFRGEWGITKESLVPPDPSGWTDPRWVYKFFGTDPLRYCESEVNNSPSFVDYLLYTYDLALSVTPIYGNYDDVGVPVEMYDPELGIGYVRDDGRQTWSAGVWALRDRMKRAQYVNFLHGRTNYLSDSQCCCHAHFLPTQSFIGLWRPCESGYYNWDASRDNVDMYGTLDRYAAYNPFKQFGQVAAGIGLASPHTGAQLALDTRGMCMLNFLHDEDPGSFENDSLGEYRDATVATNLVLAKNKFRQWEQGVGFVGYWEISNLLASSPATVHVSMFTRTDSLMLFVGNMDTNAATATITPVWSALNLDPNYLVLTDAETGTAVPLNAGAQKSFSVQVARHDLRIILIAPPGGIGSTNLSMAVSPAGSGTTTPAAGAQTSVPAGQSIPITATPAAGCIFDHWGCTSGAVISDPSAPQTNVTLSSSATVTAYFLYQWTLSVQAPTGSGTTIPATGDYLYNVGTAASVQATPAAGWNLDHWTGDGVAAGHATDNPLTVASGTANETLHVAAVFAPMMTITVESQDFTGAPLSGVTIASTTGNGGTTAGASAFYTTLAGNGAQVNLSAPATYSSGGTSHQFLKWNLDTVDQTIGQTALNFTVSKNHMAIAVYGQSFSLSVQSTPAGGATITSTTGQPGTTPYSTTLPQGLPVALTAPASFVAAGNTYLFQNWLLNGTAQGQGVVLLSFTMSQTSTATAVYIQQFTLNVQSVPTGAVITSSPAGFGGTANYSANAMSGATATLTAPSSLTSGGAAYTFTGWTVNSAAQTPGQTSVNLTILANTTAVANYAVVTHSLTVQSSGGVGSVSITGTPAAATGTTNYTVAAINDNTSVTLTAPALAVSGGTSFSFQYWLLNGVAQPPGVTTLSFNITANTTAVALYALTLSVQSVPPGVAITATPTTVNGTTNYSAQMAGGTAVTLTAPATVTVSGVTYLFQEWTLGGVAQPHGQTTIGFTLNANTTATAAYGLPALTVTSIPPGVAMTGSPAGVTTPYSSSVTAYSTVNLTAPQTAVAGNATFHFKQWILNSTPQTAGQLNLNFTIAADTATEAVYTTSDVTRPAVTGAVPAGNSIQIPADSLVQLQITDAGCGVCLTGEEAGGVVQIQPVTIAINGDTIYDGSNETSPGVYDSTSLAQAVQGICCRTGTPADYAFTFQAAAPFPFGEKVTVVVNASDNADNAMTNSYSFEVAMRRFGMNVKVNSDTGALAHNAPATTSSSAGSTAGDFWVAWDQATANGKANIYVGERPVGGIVFASSVSVDAGTSNQVNPAIAFDASSGKLYAVWQDDRSGTWGIYGASSSDGGLTWSTPFTVAAVPGFNETIPVLATDSAGNVYVAWQDDSSGYQQIWVAVSSNGGTTWTATQVTTDASAHTNPAMTVDALGTAYVVWTDGRNGAAGNGTDIYGADSAQGWTPFPLVIGPGNQSLPGIAAEATGNILHLVWADDTTGHGNIYYAATTGGLNGAPLTGTNIVDDTSGRLHTVPRIVVTGTSPAANAFVCWQDSRNVVAPNSNTDIYYAESLAGAPFGTNILVNDDKGVAPHTLPCIGVGPWGEPYMAWVDGRQGPAEIWSSDATAILPANSANGGGCKAIRATGGVVTVTGGSEPQPVTLSDVTIQIPPNAISSGITLTVSIEQVANPPAPPSGGFGINYNFSPGGLVFSVPVTITIPYPPSEGAAFNAFTVYWYNEQTGAWSTSGITDVQHLAMVSALSFKTTHFSIFGMTGGGSSGNSGGGSSGNSGGVSSSGGGGGGGGWCFIATAAYDEGIAEHVGRLPARITKENLQRLNELRRFRDEVLLPTSTGKAFTAWYYAVSPVLAERIQESREVKLFVRSLFVNPLAAAVGDGG